MASLIETVEATGGTVNNHKLLQWVEEVTRLCKPEHVYWCDGSDREYQEMVRMMIARRSCHSARSRQASQQHLRAFDSGRCGPGRGSYLYLLPFQG